MSWNKYKRLCLILFFPLLLIGFLITVKMLESQRYAYVLCPHVGESACQYAGSSDGGFYKYLKKSKNIWFDVLPRDKSDAPVTVFIEAAKLTLPEVIIKNAFNVTGDKDSVDAITSRLPGLKSMVSLGVEEHQVSTFSRVGNVLICSTLKTEDEADTFTSLCHGRSWSGFITYQTTGIGLSFLNSILDSAKEIEDKANHDYKLSLIIATPMFIYLFLILSIMWWVVLKAVKFVKNADT
ncbi:hypothetical protein [Leclercia sp.]|uniref:hypothetical protein n=1 Tax=Leclercia sp. TaxID=1898428 RepID=UPI0028BE2388|nr:hypothetical protein [Leclercia sp.]